MCILYTQRTNILSYKKSVYFVYTTYILSYKKVCILYTKQLLLSYKKMCILYTQLTFFLIKNVYYVYTVTVSTSMGSLCVIRYTWLACCCLNNLFVIMSSGYRLVHQVIPVSAGNIQNIEFVLDCKLLVSH